LNGVGSILSLERELDAAEFFVRRAIELAGGSGHYPEADDDLKNILHFKSEQQFQNE
jgi:hypothetical protein